MKKWFCDWTVLVISEATRSCVTRSRYHWQQFPEYVSVWRIGEGQGEGFAVNDSWNTGVAWLFVYHVDSSRDSILTMDRHLSFIVVEAYGSTVESVAKAKYVLH